MVRQLLTSILAIAAVTAVTPAAAQSGPGHVEVPPPPAMRTPAAEPWLGVGLEKHPGVEGVFVRQILHRSPADGSGVAVGDQIVRVGKRTVNSASDVKAVVAAYEPGDELEVVVRRSGKDVPLTFELAAMPDAEHIARNHLIGRPAPELFVRFVGDDKGVHLSEFRGKPTIIEFWATWCRPCRRVQEDLATVKDRYGDDIHILGVSDESAKRVRKHLAEHPARYAMAIDPKGKASLDYAVATIPAVVILDADHQVAAVVFGAGKRELIERKVANVVGSSAKAKQDPAETR